MSTTLSLGSISDETSRGVHGEHRGRAKRTTAALADEGGDAWPQLSLAARSSFIARHHRRAQGLRDEELLDIATSSNAETSRQLSWLNTRMKAAAPQALIVDP